jgi:hypothetical protein
MSSVVFILNINIIKAYNMEKNLMEKKFNIQTKIKGKQNFTLFYYFIHKMF